MEQLEAKFMPRDLCAVKTQTIEKLTISVEGTNKELAEFKLATGNSLTEIKGMLGSAVEWREAHQKLHESWWKKGGVLAAVIAASISVISLGITILVLFLKFNS